MLTLYSYARFFSCLFLPLSQSGAAVTWCIWVKYPDIKKNFVGRFPRSSLLQCRDEHHPLHYIAVLCLSCSSTSGCRSGSFQHHGMFQWGVVLLCPIVSNWRKTTTGIPQGMFNGVLLATDTVWWQVWWSPPIPEIEGMSKSSFM